MNPFIKPRRVIHPNNLPTRSPFLVSCVTFLMLDRFEASEFLRGIVFVLLVGVWMGYLISWYEERYRKLKELEEDS